MVEPLGDKVNAFAPTATAGETSLAARLQGLTCLLRLGRVIENMDHIEEVGTEVPNILTEGLWRGEKLGVHITLGSFVFRSLGLEPAPCVCRKKIVSRQSPIGEIAIHASSGVRLSNDQEDLVVAVAERLGRFYERKGLQSALERSEQRYKRLFQKARDGIVLVDAETGIILDANVSFLDVVGLALDELRARKIWELVAAERRGQFQAEFERMADKGESQWLSLPVAVPSRGLLELEVSCSLIHFADHPVFQFICRDITDRLRLTFRLAESEMQYRAIFDSTPVAMISCDAEGIVHDVNACLLSRFFRNQLGKEDLVGRHALELGVCDLDDRREEFLRFLEGVCVQLHEVPIPESPHRPSGHANVRCIPLLDARGTVGGGVIIIEEITEVREAQRAMIQSAKMAAVGQMTSGFAHEIGTPLGIISANAQYLLQENNSPEAAEELRVIISETNRITNLIQQLLIFSRPAKFHLVPTVVNDLVREVLDLMRGQEIMHDIMVDSDLSPDVPPVPLEPTLVKQVFLNLVLNASQAMPGGGRLQITTRAVPSQPVAGKRAPHVIIAFSDTGVGISPANLRKIFTPFFTTKEVGKGTGLGLSVSYRLVQNHGGTIIGESRGEGQGATFTVFLPLAGPQEAAAAPTGDPRKTTNSVGGRNHG